jgi:hypothetical protein
MQDFRPRIHLTESDFNSITANGTYCDASGQLGAPEFDTVMRKQVLHQHNSADTELQHEIHIEFVQIMNPGLFTLVDIEQHHEVAFRVFEHRWKIISCNYFSSFESTVR